MSTRSSIWATFQDGSVKGIYCHFDGYIEGVGRTLHDHFKSQEDAEALINLGDLSSVGNNIHTTIAYHRDREEDYHQAVGKHGGPDEGHFQAFNYWFFDGRWHVAYNCPSGWLPVDEAILKAADPN